MGMIDHIFNTAIETFCIIFCPCCIIKSFISHLCSGNWGVLSSKFLNMLLFIKIQSFSNIIAKTSVRLYVGLKKFLVFIFLYVCGARVIAEIFELQKFSIRLKFCTNVYVLFEINCIFFGVHYPNSVQGYI